MKIKFKQSGFFGWLSLISMPVVTLFMVLVYIILAVIMNVICVVLFPLLAPFLLIGKIAKWMKKKKEEV